MSAKKRNIPSKTTTCKKGTGDVHEEYLKLIHKELDALLEMLKYIGKAQWGISPKGNKSTRNISKKEIDLSDNILMERASRWRPIDAYYEAVKEFEKVYEEVFSFAKQHSLPYENFSLPKGRLLVEDDDLLDWVNSLLIEHGGFQMSFEKLFKLYTKDLIKEDMVHCLRDVITPTGLRIKIKRKIRHDLYLQYNRIKEKFISTGVGELKPEEIVHFPTPDGTKWPDVEMYLMDKDHFKIKVKDKQRIVAYSEMGFKYKVSTKKTKLWAVLIKFATANDSTVKYYAAEKEKVEKDMQRLNDVLINYFKISGNPIKYKTEKKGYEAEFKIYDTSYLKDHMENMNRTKSDEEELDEKIDKDIDDSCN